MVFFFFANSIVRNAKRVDLLSAERDGKIFLFEVPESCAFVYTVQHQLICQICLTASRSEGSETSRYNHHLTSFFIINTKVLHPQGLESLYLSTDNLLATFVNHVQVQRISFRKMFHNIIILESENPLYNMIVHCGLIFVKIYALKLR